jgi:hypothetical protein
VTILDALGERLNRLNLFDDRIDEKREVRPTKNSVSGHIVGKARTWELYDRT